MKKILSLVLVISMLLTLAILVTANPDKTNGFVPAEEMYGAAAEANVIKQNGNTNKLEITVAVGDEIVASGSFIIKNNSAGEFEVGGFKVYVSTYGNDKIDVIFITHAICALHDWAEITVEPTCTLEGYTTNICGKGCGTAYDRWDYTEPTGHDFNGNWIENRYKECLNGCGAVHTFADRYYTAETARIGGTAGSNRIWTTELAGRSLIGRFENGSDFAEFTVTVPEDGAYDLFISVYSPFGYKVARLAVNGQGQGDFEINGTNEPYEHMIGVYLREGENVIRITPSWTWFFVEYVRVDYPAVDLYALAMDFDRMLANPDADANAYRLWNFIIDNYGRNVISGQQSDRVVTNETNAILNATGQMPAILGLDMMRYTQTKSPNTGLANWAVGEKYAVNEALKWHDIGGIVTFCWHWYAPIGQWDQFYNDGEVRLNNTLINRRLDSIFNIKNEWANKNGEIYNHLIDEMDYIAGYLKELRDAGVPILWRPFHEASGGWFWWGQDRETYLDMWKFMYERYTNVHGLTNLIWVWNGQNKDWFPGAEYCDIVGTDIYASSNDYGSQQGSYYQIVKELHEAGTMKIITLSENGPIPDIDNMVREKALWSYWCVWGGNFVQQTSNTQLNKMYNDSRVITYDDLPWNILTGDEADALADLDAVVLTVGGEPVLQGLVTGNLTLPGTGKLHGSVITWSSDKISRIADDGTVNLPAIGAMELVKLTATAAKNDKSVTKIFNMVVLNDLLDMIYEAEDAKLVGSLYVTKTWENFSNFSGYGYVAHFAEDGDKVVFTVVAPEAGQYDVVAANGAPWADNADMDLIVNGVMVTKGGDRIGVSDSQNNVGGRKFAEQKYSVTLKEGENTIEYSKMWGWNALDYIRITK